MIGTRAEMAKLIRDLLAAHAYEIFAETDGTETMFEHLSLYGENRNYLMVRMKEGNEFTVRVE